MSYLNEPAVENPPQFIDDPSPQNFVREFAFAGLSPRAQAASASLNLFLDLFDDERSKAKQRQINFHADLRASFVAAYELYRALQATSTSREILRALKEKYTATVCLSDMLGIVLQCLMDYTDQNGNVSKSTFSRHRGALSFLCDQTDLALEDVDSFIFERGGVAGLYKLYLEQPKVKPRKRQKKVVQSVPTINDALKKLLRKGSDQGLVWASLSGVRKLAPWSKKLPTLSPEMQAQFLTDLDKLIEKYSQPCQKEDGANG